MKFSASLDRLTIILSILIVILFISVSIWLIWLAPDLILYGKVSIAVILLVIAVSFFMYPAGYVVSEDAVIVKGVLFLTPSSKQILLKWQR